jgi:hypothetical protein
MNKVAPWQIILWLIGLSIVGPYIFKNLSIRFEHAVIYGLLVHLIFNYKIIKDKKFELSNNLNILILFILFYVLFSILNFPKNFISTSQYLANLDDRLQILTILLVVNFYLSDLNKNLLEYFCKILIYIAIFNAAVAVLSLSINISEFLKYFTINVVDLYGNITDIAGMTLKNGRFIGIFQQPIEAGIFYTIVLFCIAYIKSINKIRTLLFIIYSILIIIGGFLTISKAFIFLGLGIFIIYTLSIFFLDKNFKYFSDLPLYIILTQLSVGLIFVLADYLNIIKYIFDRFHGFSYFYEMISNAFNNPLLFIDGLFGSRLLNHDSNSYSLIIKAAKESIFFGVGIGSQQTFDNGLIDIFFYGGIFGLLIFILILSTLITGYYGLKIYNPNEARLYKYLLIFTIICLVASPIFTLNRVSIVIWMLIGLCLKLSNRLKND